MMVSAEINPRRAGTIWSFNLDEPTPAIAPLIPADFCRLGPESVTELARAMGSGSPAPVLDRFETGRRCYAARIGGKLVAYGWVSFDEETIGELALRIRLLPGEAYIWDCATLPAYRQRHLYSALLVYIVEALRLESLCRVWIGADLDNTASHRGIVRAGFQTIADLLIARVAAMRLIWLEGRLGAPEPLVAEARRAFLDNRDQVWLTAVEELKDSR